MDAEEFVLTNVLGHMVKTIRPMTKEEYEAESWTRDGDSPDVMVMELDNGVRLYASQEKGYTPLLGEHDGICFLI